MSRRWASAMDWASRRDVITRLYMDEQLALPQVMEIMEQDYGFFATDRFRKWKLFKYRVPGAAEASQMSARASSTGKELALRKKSRQSNVKEDSREPCDKAAIQTAGSAVLSRPLASPRIFLLPETVISLTQQFFECQLQRHQHFRFDESMEWWHDMESAVRLMEASKIQEGFGELNRCFDRFAVMLKDPEIGLLSNFYGMLIRLGPPLGGRLLDYATRMAMIRLGRGHPLTLVFDTLRRAGPQEVRDGGYVILRTHFQAAERALCGTDARMLRLSAFIMQAVDWHHVDNSLPADSASILVELWRSYELLLASGHVEEAQSTLVEIAMLHVRYRRYDEAKRLADQIAAWAESCTDFDTTAFVGRAWRVRYLIALETNNVEECLLYGTRSLTYLFQLYGPEHHRAKALVAQVQAHFREKGRPELGVKLEQDIAEQVRAMSEAHGVDFKREVVEEDG